MLLIIDCRLREMVSADLRTRHQYEKLIASTAAGATKDSRVEYLWGYSGLRYEYDVELPHGDSALSMMLAAAFP